MWGQEGMVSLVRTLLPCCYLSSARALCCFPQVHIGVKGFVRDAVTKAGLENTTIVVAGIAHNITAGKYGDYHRLLVPGTYNVTAVAMG